MSIPANRPTQMNIRIGSDLKASGDAIFASWGMSPSEAVRRLYESVVSTGSLPAELVPEAKAAADAASSAHASAGLGVQVYEQLSGCRLLPDDGAPYDDLLMRSYDEMLDSSGVHHG